MGDSKLSRKRSWIKNKSQLQRQINDKGNYGALFGWVIQVCERCESRGNGNGNGNDRR